MIKLFAPHGPQNAKPTLIFSNLEIAGSPYIVGKNHLKFKVTQSGKMIDCIGFGMGDSIREFAPGKSNMDLVGVLEENIWNDRVRLQIRAKDMRIW